jgi:serine/threonine-protein kinase
VRIGRYEIFREIARGGMASVHLGRLTSAHGVERVVAIKRMHAHCATDPEFVTMFLDEARLAARVRHPNVVPVLDLVAEDEQLFMIQEYVEGETLGKLAAAARHARITDRIVAAIMVGALRGLHAAHETRDAAGAPLGIVHRDFTPHNVLIGVDGTPRVTDFGVAKAVARAQTTRDGRVKGKLGYMSPEQLQGDAGVDRRTDIFAAGVMLWELLVGKRLFQGDNDGQTALRIMRGAVDPPTDHVAGLDVGWDAITMRALALSPEARFETARDMAGAIEAGFPIASPDELGAWVTDLASEELGRRAQWVAALGNTPPPDEPATDTATPPPTARPRPPAAAAARGLRAKAGRAGLLFAIVAAAAAAGVALAREAERRTVQAAPPEPAPPAPTAAGDEAVSDSAPAAMPADTASPGESAAAATITPPRPVQRPRAPPRAGAPSASAPQSCRYFDAKEKIWKFRVECYQ